MGPRNPGSDAAGEGRAAIQFASCRVLRNYNDVTLSLGVQGRSRQRSELTVIRPAISRPPAEGETRLDLLEILRAHLVEELSELLHLALLVVALDEDGGLAEHV